MSQVCEGNELVADLSAGFPDFLVRTLEKLIEKKS